MSEVLGGILGGALAAGGSIYNNERNIWMQQQTNAQNERLMREAWGREDTAVQRRAADMEAAGFNPVLATGAPASSMPAVRAEAPQARENVGMSALQGAMLSKDMAIKDRQAQLLQKQADAVELDNQLKARTLDPNVQVAVERAAQAVRDTEIRSIEATSKQTDMWIKAGELRMQQQDIAIKEEWARLSAALDYQVKEVGLDQARADVLRAIAIGKLTGQEARDYTSLGISESVVDRIMKLIDLAIRLFSRTPLAAR